MEQLEVMTVEQVAKFLQLSKRIVYEYVKKGKIPAVMVGNKFRFSKKAVIEALEQGFSEKPRVMKRVFTP
jgi:PTS system nitrogen regulatory IIA component